RAYCAARCSTLRRAGAPDAASRKLSDRRCLSHLLRSACADAPSANRDSFGHYHGRIRSAFFPIPAGSHISRGQPPVTALATKGLGIDRGGRRILNGISLELSSSQVLGLVG